MNAHPALSGIALRLVAVFLITAMSAVVHEVGARAALGQIIFWRSSVALIPILGYMALRSELPKGLQTKHPRLHLTRGLFGAASMAFSFVSLIYLPVANAQALAYLAPVLTLPLAALHLREPLRPQTVLAVALGFGGALMMLWHALDGGQNALIGVAAGIAYALTMAVVRVHIKAMTRTESAATIALYFALICSGIGLATLPLGWPALSGTDLTLLAIAGLLGGLAHIASTEAVARAPVSTVAPFDFTGLIWALGIDALLFRIMPTPLALAGMGVILLAGLIVIRQEMRPAKP
ncbi:DMT family transporter [Donghicola sp. C2-DW-16]|uniref:DMT family transporter n=1 Tax=Donghicola mangrovi TaxID=2729614 RepID=A0ABX2PFJ0_9RHOB|nr:DMT family transporter [Donghicola mangrovi]NVO28253.1 DMT family transporter [Donghicola mangrovi]